METITSTSTMDRRNKIITLVLSLLLVGILFLVSSRWADMWGMLAFGYSVGASVWAAG